MAGMLVFYSVLAAINAGYEMYDHTPTGYLARTKTSAGWAMALVELRSPLGGGLE